MAFINLKLIGELYLEAHSQHMMAQSQSFGWEREKPLDSITYMGLMKSYFQGENLFSQLQKLHQLCTDFAAGNFEASLKDFEEFAEEGDVFDPVQDIQHFFAAGDVYALPPRIEQYAELMATARAFTRVKSVLRDGIKKFFPTIEARYLTTNDEGEEELVPASEMPQDFINEIEANRDIKEIEVEYCLDKYNDFYHACKCLVDIHACSAEYDTEQQAAQGLAKDILGYFNK